MREYIGKYRVVCEFNKANLEPIQDDTYITCSKDGQIYRYNNDTLVYYRPTRGNSEQLTKKLEELGVEVVSNGSGDGDIQIYFKEKGIEIVASELGAITTGASTNPKSIRNLRKLKWFKDNKQQYIDNGYYKELSEEEKEIYRERFTKNVLDD